VTGFFWASAAYTLVAGAKSYELSNHLGNVMAVISDRGELQSATDYFPFGMAMPGRNTPEKHRYGFNGKETDPETGLNDFGARLYDSRLGRWLAVDPLTAKFSAWSPYVSMDNNPLFYTDPTGTEVKKPETTKGGGENGRDLVTIKVVGKIINYSGKNINMENARDAIVKQAEASFQGKDIPNHNCDVKFIFELTVANTLEEVAENDHLIILGNGVDNNTPGGTQQFGGLLSVVDAKYFEGTAVSADGTRTAAHEIGHLLNLEHESVTLCPEYKLDWQTRKNLMAQGGALTHGNEICTQQLASIMDNLKGGHLNKGSNWDSRDGLPLLGITGKKFRIINTPGRGLKPETINQRTLLQLQKLKEQQEFDQRKKGVRTTPFGVPQV
jgi:RHS repeat-associated protein